MSLHTSQNPPGLATGPLSVDQLTREVNGLQVALQTRDIIGQAKGIIRLLTRSNPDTAFALLARISQDTNRKLEDVATLIAESSAAGLPLPADIATSWRRRTTPALVSQPDSQAS